jgi:uncharacterized protein YlaI
LCDYFVQNLKVCEDPETSDTVKFQQVYFVLDKEFRLLWVGGEWDDFANANGGQSARINDVLSTSLLDHIADDDTKRAMVRLVEAVMDVQEPLKIDYRCDNPEMLRRFQMTVQPMKEGRVLVVHDLRDAQSFKVPLFPWRHNPHADEKKCSFCNRVKFVGKDWQTPESLGDSHPDDVAFVLCGDCEHRVEEAISALRDGRKPLGAITGGFSSDVT